MLKKIDEDIIIWEERVSDIIEKDGTTPEEDRITPEIIYSLKASMDWEKSNIP